MAFTKGTANFTNGSKTVTSVSLTSGQLAYFASGTAVFIQSEGQLIEATGLPKDGSGNVIQNQFLLRGNWTGPTGSYNFVAFDTIEGLRDAVQSARGFSEQLEVALSSFSVAPEGDSNVKRTNDGRVKASSAKELGDTLTKGDFGLAGTGVFLSDFNNAVSLLNAVCGFIAGSSGSANSAFNGGGIQFGRSSNEFTQIQARPDAGRLEIRGTSDGVDFTDWLQIYFGGNAVGAVSESDGVPTGAIIERGSNSNGEYVKYTDGTLVCWLTTFYTFDGSDTISGTWTYPAGFIKNSQNGGDARKLNSDSVQLLLNAGGRVFDGNSVVSSVQLKSSRFYDTSDYAASPSQAAFLTTFTGFQNSPRETVIGLYAIGRWY